MVEYLSNAFQVGNAIYSGGDKLVVISFAHRYRYDAPKMDLLLHLVAEKVKKSAVIYSVDISNVPELIVENKLFDPYALMFFYGRKLINIDSGSGHKDRFTSTISGEQDMIELIETVFAGAKKGRSLVVLRKDYSGSGLSAVTSLLRHSSWVRKRIARKSA